MTLNSRFVPRRGAMAVLIAIMLPLMLIFMAIAIEISRVHAVQTELQSAADAGALAGAAMLRHLDTNLIAYSFSLAGENPKDVEKTVPRVVNANQAGHLGPNFKQKLSVATNPDNAAAGDIVLGNYTTSGGFLPSMTDPDSVKVVVGLTGTTVNGQLPLLFRKILNTNALNLSSKATAKVNRPTLLPFVIHESTWINLVSGVGLDNYQVNDGVVSIGSDGIVEATVFTKVWDGSGMPPGNFGWVNLSADGGTNTIRRHVDSGPTRPDIDEMFGGQINAGDLLSGQTGFRAGAEVAFTGGEADGVIFKGIFGEPRILAVFDQAFGTGTTAQFQVSKFVLVYIVSAQMSGDPRGIVLQLVDKANDPHRVRLVE